MPTLKRRELILLLCCAVWSLAACGGSTPSASVPGGSVAPSTTAAPSTSTAGRPVTSTAPSTITPMSADKGAAPSAAATVTTSTASGKFGGIPQSKTPEGYYVLGQSTAPIVMVHYSDFL